MDFEFDPLDRERARAEARSRLFASPDRVTLGRYELRARLGAGSWGTVYQALDPLTSRMVALKVSHVRVTGHPQRLERWRREAQLLAKLDHPHVIGVFDVGVDAGRAYLVTQLVPTGRTLTQWLSTTSETPDSLLRKFASLADALAAVHAVGVLHRDIKPDNILVDANGDFRLADFGLASEVQDIPSFDPARRFEGTPAFLPPEVRRGAAPDKRADVYSLCGSLWFAISGAPPRQGKTPRGLRGLFNAGLAAEPTERFANATALRHALEHAAPGTVPWPHLAASLGVAVTAALALFPPVTRATQSSDVPGRAAAREPAAHANGALERIAQLHASEDFDRAEQVALRSIRTAERPATRARFQLALGRARYANDAYEEAEHVLESAFFYAAAAADVDLASRAALLRLEVALDRADRWGGEIWAAEAASWLGRRTTSASNLELRLATATSKRWLLAGRPNEALEALPTSVDPNAHTPRAAIAFLFQRGELLNRQGDSTEGVRTLEVAQALAERHFPEGHGLRRSATWNLSAAEFERGHFATAAKGFEALLRSSNNTPAWPPSEIAGLQRNLGAAYFELGDMTRALKHAEAALAASTSAHGEAHPNTLDALGNLAAILHMDGQTDAAGAMSWRALVAAETAYGPRHPLLVSLLSNLAVMSADAEVAEAMLRRAEDIVETHLGPQHSEMALIQTNLARALSRQGHTADALRSATRALEIGESALGPDHPHLGEPLLQLASLEITAGQLKAARAHALRLRQLDGVPGRLRARAAFTLAQLEALSQPAKSPSTWLDVAAHELEHSSSGDQDTDFARALESWQLDWKAELSKLRP